MDGLWACYSPDIKSDHEIDMHLNGKYSVSSDLMSLNVS